MKFAEHLSAHITPEWRKQYITYEVSHQPSKWLHNTNNNTIDLIQNMKEMLYSAVDQLANDTQELNDTNVTIDSVDTNDESNESLKQFEEQFFLYCDHELSKINTFFAEKLAEAIRRFSDLKSELNSSQHLKQNGLYCLLNDIYICIYK